MTSYFLGIDGGGSKCKAILVDQHNKVLGEGLAGPANPFHDVEQAIQSIIEAAEQALAEAKLASVTLADLIVGMGLAGVNLPAVHQTMLNWQHPFKQCFITTDLHVACLGAHQGEDGAVIVTGTGSCGFSYVNEKSLSLGGHGFPHGDKGSGAWLGFKAVEQVLLSLDGLALKTQLAPLLLSHMNASTALEIVEHIAGKSATYYGTLAQHVFAAAQNQDTIATKLLNEAGLYISELADKLFEHQAPSLSLVGGLSTNILPWLSSNIQQKISKPLYSPEMGAVFYAQQHHAKL